MGITPGRRRSARLPWGWGRHVGASFDAQKQPGVRCHVHRRGGPCDRWLSPPNYEEGLGRCPSAGVRRRGCWLARNTHMFSGCCPGFERKIGGFARPTCRKFGGDLPRHRRDVLRLRCEGMGLRATSERRDLVSAAEQAGGARCEATTSGGRGVRTASAVTVAISFVPLPLRPPPRPPIPARHPHTHFAGTRAVSLGGHRSGGLGGTSDGRARLRLGVLGCLGRSADRAQKAPVGQVDSEFAIGGCHHRHPDGKPDPPVHCRLPRRGFRAAAADFVMGDFGRPITRVRGAGKKN